MEQVIRNYQKGILEQIRETFPCPEQDIRTYSPLTLAYIGDGIYELVVRTVIVEKANRRNGDLHKMSVRYVKAESQSKMAECLKTVLTQEESDVFRRGKNASPHSTAKNASRGDYHRATGFEALMGYLYLTGRTERMLELIRMGMERLENGGKSENAQ